jgi:hypothetical protein
MKAQSAPNKAVAAKVPAIAELEIEVPASSAASQQQLTPFDTGYVRGEIVTTDYGSLPRLSLISPTSDLAKYLSPGQWGLANGLGIPTALGEKVEIIPVFADLWWLQDYGQGDSGGPPIRKRTEAEVREYGGTTTRESDKIMFSRSMELRLLLPDTKKADETFLRQLINGKTYLLAVYEATRTAFRSIGTGLILTWQYSQEAPHYRSWVFGITTKHNRQIGKDYFAPTLTRGEPTSATDRSEISKLIDRQLLA